MEYSVRDLAYELNISAPTIRSICKTYNIIGINKRMQKTSHMAMYYNEDQMEMIKVLAISAIRKNYNRNGSNKTERKHKTKKSKIEKLTFEQIGESEKYNVFTKAGKFKGVTTREYLIKNKLI